MQPFSAWPVRFCLVGVAGFTLGATLIPDVPTLAGNPAPQVAVLWPTLEVQGDDRGSGRLRHPAFSQEVGFRGSGRVAPHPQRPNTQSQAVSMAYRGSGRVKPQNPTRT